MLNGAMMVVTWVAILLVVWFAASRSREHKETLIVKSLNITIADSTAMGNLVTTKMVQNILKREKIKSVGLHIDSLPLSRIERVIGANGFVASVRAYTNYSGELHLEIHQRDAAARIMLKGYNSYISSNGYIFNAPPQTALYTPVITGSYKPLFPAGYVGSIDDYTQAEIDKLTLEIEKIERERYPIYHRELKNNEDKRDVRRRYINKSIFESQDVFDRRVADLREENLRLRNLYTYRQRVIESELHKIDLRQEAVRERQKKLQKNCDDIHNLITFVNMIEEDDFWRSEIVQIDLESGSDGMIISFSVRSAGFKVRFGSLLTKEDYHQRPKQLDENQAAMKSLLSKSSSSASIQNADSKRERKRQEEIVENRIESRMERLKKFYKEALPRVGWDRYQLINIEFENQVVCKK